MKPVTTQDGLPGPGPCTPAGAARDYGPFIFISMHFRVHCECSINFEGKGLSKLKAYYCEALPQSWIVDTACWSSLPKVAVRSSCYVFLQSSPRTFGMTLGHLYWTTYLAASMPPGQSLSHLMGWAGIRELLRCLRKERGARLKSCSVFKNRAMQYAHSRMGMLDM